MHANEELIDRFYTAFNARDADTMAASYADDATFEDPAFGRLTADEARAMWRMLLGRATDLRAEFRDIRADGQTGSAHWEAYYTFSRRPVHNVIDADFSFRDGLIIEACGQFRLATLGGTGSWTVREAARRHEVPSPHGLEEGACPTRRLSGTRALDLSRPRHTGLIRGSDRFRRVRTRRCR